MDGAKYQELKDALEKLKLNDASLQYEPEVSQALGFGFRCGFLGLLHLEIISERIEREFNLDIITTAPGVYYLVHKTNGEVLKLSNPSSLPSPVEIDYIEEPYVKAGIFAPPEYVGAIMELCQDKRGIYKNLTYLEEKRVRIDYKLPLGEIIYDFFDSLKSRTKGYASFDWQVDSYEESKLVKVGILVNGENVDALSLIMHQSQAIKKGRQLVEKLKEEIPRQMFKIAIQASMDGKIIAREDLSGYKKDVLAKCYGGDISRKKKLLEKQKKGKKRMRSVGNVEIPQSAFLAVLKVGD